jgi:hypothetical protein
MGWPFEPAEIGERLTRVFFEAWERPDSRAVEPAASTPVEELIRRVAPVITSHLTS